MRIALATFLVLQFGSGLVQADSSQPPDAMAWLKKIAAASSHLNYTGTFVYHHGNQAETSQVWHLVEADGEHERLATLDGPPREVIRSNEDVTCYLPEKKVVVIQKRIKGRFHFPALLPEDLSGITENYIPVMAEQDRVAGLSCQVILLKPKDNLRYGHYFCAELATGLPLRVRTLNDHDEMIESFAFTQINIGSGINRNMLKPQFAAESKNWRIDRAEFDQSDATAKIGWMISNQVPGFKQLAAIRRSLPGHPSMSQIVYSDGLAAISVFIEPLLESSLSPGPTSHGAINVYVQPEADRMVTVMGEAPPQTIKLMAESIAPEEK